MQTPTLFMRFHPIAFLLLLSGTLMNSPVMGSIHLVLDADTIRGKNYSIDTLLVYDTLVLKPTGGRLKLSCHYIAVHDGGALIVEADRFELNLGNGGNLFVMGGLVRMEGNPKQPYVRLSANAAAASSTILLDSIPRFWAVGDRIVVTPSNNNAYDFDTAVVVGITGNQVLLDQALVHPHDGGLGIYSAEVINISRALRITGRNWTLTAMPNSTVQLRGVEFAHGGQRSIAGRYPVHFHFTGDAYDSYVEHCAIHHSQHRGIALHRVHGVQVRFNALHDIWSHGIVVGEDGISTNLDVSGNIVHFSRPYADAEMAFPQGQLINGRLSGSSAQSEGHAGSYWVTNYCNDVHHNIAAGGEGTNGFYLDGSMGRDMETLESNNRCAGNFDGNIAHSYRSAMLDNTAGIFKSYLGHGAGWFQDQFEPDTLVVDSFVAFNCHAGGIWSESMQTTFTNADVRGCHYGILLMRGFVDGAYVDRSSPTSTPSPLPERDLGALRIEVHETHLPLSLGPWAFRDITVRNYEHALFVDRSFEGPAYLQGIDFDGPEADVIHWPEHLQGVIYHYDSAYAIVNGVPRNEAFRSVWFDDADSCSPFEAYPLCYSLQEGLSFWNNCSEFPWLPGTHYVANSNRPFSKPPGAESVRAWGFPGDTARVDCQAYPVNHYGFAGPTPSLPPSPIPDTSGIPLNACGGALLVNAGVHAFNATDLSSPGTPSACSANDVNDIWFAYVPSPGAERINLRTCGVADTHTLSIWSGCPSDPCSVQLGCLDMAASSACGSIDSAEQVISLLTASTIIDTLFIRIGHASAILGELEITEGSSNPCNPSLPPQNLYNTITPTSFVVSTWDAVPYSLGCQMRGWAIDTVQPWLWAVFVPELDEVMLSTSELIPNTTYGWQVRCACSLDPVVATPWSDTAYVTTPPALRLAIPNTEIALNVWPNPSSDVLFIAAEDLVQVYNSQGQIVATLPASSAPHRLDVGQWPPGIYTIQSDQHFRHAAIGLSRPLLPAH